ncbi:MAG TPA: hydroxymethylglutaryl-CoA reductase, degradative [Candidatus Nitrosocosmicus sp.]|nr:hydroxymethylglutaryl-CoA reductase, degradative [Candidatus Nitrosocosmicus sp.]
MTNNFFEKKIRNMNHQERLEYLKKNTKLEDNELTLFNDNSILKFDEINKMIENAIGSFQIPLGIANNFVINDKEYLIPMAIEEPSVIAASSNAAKIAKETGGFKAQADKSIMIGQIQLVPFGANNNDTIYKANKAIIENKFELIKLANTRSKSAKCIDLQTRQVNDESINNLGSMIIIEIFVDTKDAMGANVVNTMCEIIGPKIESLTKGQVILKILSNYATNRLVKCKGVFPKSLIGGDKVLKRILYAYAFAYSDVYRAVTHNKGIMNGIDSIAIATGQDFRAIESSCHAYACRDGKYRSLTKWYENSEGDLIGEIEIPLAVGIIGGITNVHPIVQTCIKILNISSSQELAIVMAAVGLAQNFSAIRALSDEGIQKGHMKLHSKNIAKIAGARNEQIEEISEQMIKEGNISVSRAKEIIERINKTNKQRNNYKI